MGMSRLSSIQAGLRAAGLPAEMPAAVIERAASPDERVLVTSLGLLARGAAGRLRQPGGDCGGRSGGAGHGARG